MPLYFFNIRGDGFDETDVVGKRCKNDVAALSEAMLIASEIVQQRLADLHVAHYGAVDVEDEGHRSVLSLPLRAAAY
ncbi:MAG: hypothetical protein JWO25_2690 [Alphaproteobacteria bacterium]|nr:hypothetical protein [Alphaproteobacteria bacterium]